MRRLPISTTGVSPAPEELEALNPAGACDGLGLPRTQQFWEAQVCRRRQTEAGPLQGWLLAPPALEHVGTAPLQEPADLDRLRAEEELFGYTVSGHPSGLYPDIAWDTFCPVSRLREFVGQDVVLCGRIVVTRMHTQEGGAPMKFLTLASANAPSIRGTLR